MNKNILFLLALLVTACSDVTDNSGTALEDGKYPMTFTAAMDGLTATRATTDNTWTGDEEIAVQIGNEMKKYTVTAGGTLSAATGVTPFYWQSTANISINAWYPYSATKPATFTVKADQSGTGYQASDCLEAVNATVAFSTPELTFSHRTAKVVVTLQTSEGVTDADVASAAVAFVNQASVENGGTAVTPKAGSTSTFSALLVPQQMQSKQFVKVTVGGATPRDYYYTPTSSTAANLEAGHQYTYTITVKKTGLEVSAGTSVSWTDSDLGDSPATNATFRVTIPTVDGINNLTFIGAAEASGKAYYEVQNHANTFSLTYTAPADGTMKGFPAVQGLCKVKRTLESDGKYKFTYTNIRSDLKLAYDVYAEEGDFYCQHTDGTGYLIPGDVPSLTDEQQKACLGVVFKAGRDATGDWKDDCTYFLKDGITPMSIIHGYVLALHDANSGNACAWGPTNTTVGTNMERNTGFYGYKNTQAIKRYAITNSKTLQNDFPATYCATEGYEVNHAAPAGSSGWFLPSAGQGRYWLNNRKVLLTSVKKATDYNYAWKNYYWLSSESNSNLGYAWLVDISRNDESMDGDSTGGISNINIDYKNQSHYVRSIFAF